jgi:hypothetical protein
LIALAEGRLSRKLRRRAMLPEGGGETRLALKEVRCGGEEKGPRNSQASRQAGKRREWTNKRTNVWMDGGRGQNENERV